MQFLKLFLVVLLGVGLSLLVTLIPSLYSLDPTLYFGFFTVFGVFLAMVAAIQGNARAQQKPKKTRSNKSRHGMRTRRKRKHRR